MDSQYSYEKIRRMFLATLSIYVYFKVLPEIVEYHKQVTNFDEILSEMFNKRGHFNMDYVRASETYQPTNPKSPVHENSNSNDFYF